MAPQVDSKISRASLDPWPPGYDIWNKDRLATSEKASGNFYTPFELLDQGTMRVNPCHHGHI